MEMLYCWRCKTEVPMLDENEYAKLAELYRFGMRQFGGSATERMRPACEWYERKTGVVETNANVIMHHRIALYGEPCGNCAKPLRSPQAAFCAACGWKPALDHNL